MTAGPTWIEAALNGPWGRDQQPGIPVAVEEIVADGLAAAAAGAAIVHLHAYDSATGRQRDDWEIYARIIEGIRARSDALVYPTIPLAGSAYADKAGGPAARFAHTEELARRGLIEIAVVDPGSVDFLRFGEVARPGTGFVYRNEPEEVRAGLEVCARHGVRPGYAIYEPGFTRMGAALARVAAPGVLTPLYRFMFSDEFAWGFPPRARYLDAHLGLLAEAAPGAPWMVAGLGVDVRPLIGAAVERGGHVRVGLEDAPWGSALTNRAWVEAAAQAVRAAGGEPATPALVRAALAACDADAHAWTGRVGADGTTGPEREVIHTSVLDTPARPVRAAWAAGRAARNAWLTIPDAHLAEMVAARGVSEAVTLDLQHGLFDRGEAVHAIRAISAHGAAPLVRLPGVDAALTGYVLDAGAAGVIAPQVESAAQAEALVAACRYPPAGHRSHGPTRVALRPGSDAFAAAEQAVVFAMVETRAGLEGCEAMAAVGGLDGLFVGPGDLGLSLGIGAGQDRDEPEMRDAFARVLAACRKAGKRTAIHASSVRYAAQMARLGFDLVTVWVDAAAIAATLAATADVWAQEARG